MSATSRLAVWVLDELLPRTRFAQLLEVRMSLTDDALVQLDDATNEVATELDEIRAQLSDQDSVVASRIDAASARLRGLASDPENPVPTDPATDGA